VIKRNKITKYCKECGTGATVNSIICTSCGAELKTSNGMAFVMPIRDREKIEEMKQYLKSNNIRDWAWFTLGINSALRISDILKITVSDVIDENGKIRERLKVKETKTGKSKDFPFSQNVINTLTEYISTVNPIGVLFPSRKGEGAISRVQANNIISKAAIAIGIKENIGSHSCRKTWAFQAYEKGVPLVKIMTALNHASERDTMRYLGITQEGLDDVYLDLNL